MLDRIAQNLEQDPNGARIKKLVFCASNGRWSNDAQYMSSQEFQHHLRTLYDHHPTIVDFKHALYQIVMRLNHSNDYYAVANALCSEIENIYDAADRKAEPFETLEPQSEPLDLSTRIIFCQISAPQLQFVQIDCMIEVDGQEQGAATLYLPLRLIEEYGSWQALYRKLDPTPRRAYVGAIGIAPERINQCQDATAEFLQQWESWFHSADCQPLQEQIQRWVSPTAPVQVVVASDQLSLLKLPWNRGFTSLLSGCPALEVLVRLAPSLELPDRQVSICAVIANGAGIDAEKSQAYLQSLANSFSQYWVESDPATVLVALANPGSVLFLSSYASGYSAPERIFVNPNDSITGVAWRRALQFAVRQGLQLLILNVGDGLEVAASLADLGIPHMVVMRELVPDRVANELMKLILKAMAKGLSLPQALQASRTRLQEIERVFPAVSWLPVLCQPRAVEDLYWSDLALMPMPARENLTQEPADTAVSSPLNGNGKTPSLTDPVEISVAVQPPVIQIVPAADYETMSLEQCLTGYHSEVMAVAISADRQYIISGHGDLGYKDNNIKVWSLATGELLHDWAGHTNWVKSIVLTVDNHSVLSAGADGKILSWHLRTGKPLPLKIIHSSGLNTLVVSPDGDYLIGGGDDGMLEIWNMTNGKVQQSLAGHQGAVTAIALDRTGQVMATAGDDGVVRIWDMARPQRRHQLIGHSGRVNGIVLTGDGHQAISAGSDRTIRIWQTRTGQLLHTLVGHERPVNCITLTPDNRSIISGSDDKTIKIWSLADGSLVNNLSGHDSPILSLATSNDGQLLVTGGYGEIRIWEISPRDGN